MDETKLAEWEQLAEKATPGKWYSPNMNYYRSIKAANDPKVTIADTVTMSDATFIIAARTAVPELCAEVRRLRAQVEAGKVVVSRGVDLMTVDQLSQWNGVRSWLEQDSDVYCQDIPA